MNWQDYQQTAYSRKASIGILKGQYVMERMIQSGMASEFRKLSKEEYDSYALWCQNDDEIMRLRLYNIWCIGYRYTGEFQLMKE